MKISVIKPFLILLLFFALGYGIYSNTLEVNFIYDDVPRIKENPHIQITELSLKELARAGIKSSSTRPFGFITFALNYYFHQFNIKGYHVVNIIIHILTATLLYLVVKTTLSIPLLSSRYSRPEVIAFFTALIWLVYPLHTQSVTYIVQRLNSLAAMFYLLSLLLYIKGRLAEEKRKSWLWFAGSALSSILAIGSKQNAAMLPFFILLFEWYFFQDMDRNWLKRKMKYIFCVAALFCLIALFYLGTSPLEKLKSINDFAHNEFTLSERILTQFRVVIYYLSLLVYPHPSRLNLDHDFPLSHSLVDPVSTLVCLCLIVGFVSLAVYWGRKERLLSFCILWFFGNLVIESSVIPLAIIYEHRTYLPSMFICLLAVSLGYRYIKVKWLGVALVCMVVTVFSFWTFQRNSVWSDPMALWSDCVTKSPQKARPHNNLGIVLGAQGKTSEAIGHYNEALRINPRYAKAHSNLGNALVDQGQLTEAVKHYSEALRINPRFAIAHKNLGNALAEQGQLTEAVKHYSEALRINPRFEKAHNNLGIVLKTQGKTSEAIGHYYEALRINPRFAEAHNNLGNALMVQEGATDKVISHFKEALRLNPKYVDTYSSLSVAMMHMGKVDEAIDLLRKAILIDPNLAAAYVNLGGALMLQNKSNEAMINFNKALQINPDLAEAHVNLGIILSNKERLDEAVAHFRKALEIDPDNDEAQFNLNKVSTFLNEIDVNIERTQKDLALKPEQPFLYLELGNMYSIKGELDKAIAQYQKAISLQPDFPEALYHLAKLHIKRGEHEKALSLYQKVITLLPDNPSVYYNVACIYANQNKPEESVVWLKKAVEKGFNDWKHIKTDSDLDNIRSSSYYKEFIKEH